MSTPLTRRPPEGGDSTSDEEITLHVGFDGQEMCWSIEHNLSHIRNRESAGWVCAGETYQVNTDKACDIFMGELVKFIHKFARRFADGEWHGDSLPAKRPPQTDV